jgi:hypothetical protein
MDCHCEPPAPAPAPGSPTSCMPAEHNPKIRVVKSYDKDCKEITSLMAPKPDGIDRDQPGTKVFTTRMWMAKANQDLDKGSPSYAKNWDQLEGSYPEKLRRIVGYHKTLDHDANGELTDVGLANYKKFVCGVLESDIYKIDEVRGFGNQRVGFAGVNDATNGNIGGQSATGKEMPPAYSELSDEGLAEFVEIYLMQLALDVPFISYPDEISKEGSPIKLAKEVLMNADVNNYLLQRSAHSGVYTPWNIFRDRNPGTQKGPYMSQFFLHNIAAGASMGAAASWNHQQKYASPKPLIDTSSAVSWAFTPGQAAALLNGLTTETFNGVKPDPADPTKTVPAPTLATKTGDNRACYIYSGRTLAAYVTEEPRAQRVYDAALILANWGVPINPGLGQPFPNTRDNNTNSHPSSPQVYAAILSDLNNTLVYYWKYFTNRRVRPEAMGLYVHNAITGVKDYGFPKWFLDPKWFDEGKDGNLKKFWVAVAARNAQIASKYGGSTGFSGPSYTFPVQTRAGNPNHPCYPAGHAAAIAGVAALKFFYNCDTPLANCTNLKLQAGKDAVGNTIPVVNTLIASAEDLNWSKYSLVGKAPAVNDPFYLEATEDGSQLYVKHNTDPTWTVNDEVDKLMGNFARAREWLGMHYRIDDNEGVKFCEEAALRYLKDHITLWGQNRIIRDSTGKIVDLLPPEVPVTKYDGTRVVIAPHFAPQ